MEEDKPRSALENRFGVDDLLVVAVEVAGALLSLDIGAGAGGEVDARDFLIAAPACVALVFKFLALLASAAKELAAAALAGGREPDAVGAESEGQL